MRSAGIRKLTLEITTILKADISQYREYARKLSKTRKHPELLNQQPFYDDVHMSVSLKHNHIYNDFAHLIYLEALKSKQLNLFDDL